MEKLVYLVLAILAGGLLGLFAGFWMIHTGINAGDAYKVCLGFLVFGLGMFCASAVLAARG